MLEYLTQLPCETLGPNILGFLELIDIIHWENASASQESQQLLRAILAYCPPIVVSNSWNSVKFNHIVCNWFSNRRCRVQFIKIPVESLCEVNFEHSVMYDITLCWKEQASLKDIVSLNDPNIRDKITKLEIESDQDPAVIEVLFSLLTKSSVRSLSMKISNLFMWMEHIKKIGPCLHELVMGSSLMHNHWIKTITECCPYLEKLSVISRLELADTNILQSIGSNCPHVHSISIGLDYSSSAEADADLTAFAEKCPQLEELSLNCQQFTDQSVIALTQHCSRLKKLELRRCKLTVTSLIALSERGLPLEELNIIPRIPIPSAEIAAQCAHALSRIRQLSTQFMNGSVEQLCFALQYMTGLRELELRSSEDHLLVPHLLLLLQGQCCACLETLAIGLYCSIAPQQLCGLVAGFPLLHKLNIYNPTCSSDAVLVELARSCPHLQKITLDNRSELTGEGVLTLAALRRQLREINIPLTTVTEKTVRQLAQHCRRLTALRVTVRKGDVMVGHYKHYFSKDVKALRENTSSRVPSPQHSRFGGDSHSYTLYIQNIFGVCALLVVIYACMVYK